MEQNWFIRPSVGSVNGEEWEWQDVHAFGHIVSTFRIELNESLRRGSALTTLPRSPVVWEQLSMWSKIMSGFLEILYSISGTVVARRRSWNTI